MDLSKINKKLITYVGIGVGVVALIFVVLFVIKIMTGGKLSYENIESKMIDAAERYYEDEEHKLPSESETVSVETLVSEKYMKPLEKYTKKNVTCTGEVKVSYNGLGYTYTPYLDCGDKYKTKELYKEIIKDSNLVTEDSGLYYINNKYIYRGEYVNNYIKYAGSLWRIISVDADGNIKILQEENKNKSKWDNRYNEIKKSKVGITNYEKSRLRETITELIDGFKDTDKAKLYKGNICIGGRTPDEIGKDGSIECKTVLEGEYAGLLTANEFLIASLQPTCNKIDDAQCMNYNYLATYQRAFWILTPNSEWTHMGYKLTSGRINNSTANTDGYVRLTVTLNNNVLYKSGDGTKENPYILK